MTFYVPKVHYNPQIEQITIPNKNIQSYYMKSENSYFVKEDERFSEYKKEDDTIVTVIITPSDIIIGTTFEDCVVLTNNSKKYKNDDCIQDDENLSQHAAATQEVQNTATQEATTQEKQTQENNKNYKNIFEKAFVPNNIIEDCEFFDKLFLLGNFAKNNFSSIFECQMYLLNKIKEIYNLKNTFVNLVFNDTLVRTEIISIVDMFINKLACKGIMVMPYSLVCCFGYNIPNASVLVKYKNFTSLCFIEDNCWIDCNYIKEDNTNVISTFYDFDAEDFVEDEDSERIKRAKLNCICAIKCEANKL